MILRFFLAKVRFGKTVVDLKQKDTVFAQRDPANAVFYIQKGRVTLAVVTKNGEEGTIAILGPRDEIPAKTVERS